MDEAKNKISSEESPFRALDGIDSVLASAYKDPGKRTFSNDKNEALIQKAVLYHRIKEDSRLRTGEQSATNNIRYEQLASKIIEGKDPVVQFIQGKKVEEQGALLEELMRSDSREAWFENMLMRSEEKKAEAASSAQKNTLSGQLNAVECNAQSNLYRALADNRGASPKEFLSKPDNFAAVRRMLAVELHRQQVEASTAEFMEAIRYESPEKQDELIRNRPPFPIEQQAMGNTAAYFAKLENTPEINSIIHNMTRFTNIEEIGKTIKNPPQPKALHLHECLDLTEEKLIPDAINAFLSSPEAPKKDSSLYKAIKELTDNEKTKLPSPPSAEDCDKRIKAYQSVIKKLEGSEFAQTKQGKEFKEVLDGQINRLQDVAVTPVRDKFTFNFRADTLIDYMDPNDPSHRPMDAIEAREKLIRGQTLEQKTFAEDDFVGTVQTVSYDKKTGLVNKGPEKLITRVMNLSDKTGKKPELQIEELRKIKEVLKQSDPFYVHNSEGFNNVMQSLDKLIKAQESLNKDANIRKVEELRMLYSELDTNAAKYVKSKDERMKTGDERGQLRMDAIKTLQSITDTKHVEKVTREIFVEQKKLDNQQKFAEPCNKIMEKWKKAGTPSTKEQYAEFKKDFQALSNRFNMIAQNFGDSTYFKSEIAENLNDFTKKAEEVQKNADSENKLGSKKLQDMKKLAEESSAAHESVNALEGLNPAKKKEVKKETPKKEVIKVNTQQMKL